MESGVSSGDQFDPRKFSEDLRDQIHDEVHDRIRARMGRRIDRRPGLLPGVLLIAFGAIILLDHLGVISVDRLWSLWPLIIIVVGLVRFVECPTGRAASALLIMVGGVLLLNNLGYIKFAWGELWPMFLIAAGVAMIWGRMAIRRMTTPLQGAREPNMVTASAVFGGVERRVSMSNFKGGTVSAVFGGVELDFRGADIEGDEAILYVEAIFGGIEIIAPERWMVIFEGQSMFAGYSDETRPPLPDVPGATPRKRLILRGQAVFGGITIKN
jgi:predicted membrane protein